MEKCLCNRLYGGIEPFAIKTYAFGKSLCRIREFETLDGSRYCLTLFRLYDYKYLHLPHEEYMHTINKIRKLYTPHAFWHLEIRDDPDITVKQLSNGQYNIKFGCISMHFGKGTAYWLQCSAPFLDKRPITCCVQLDVCACEMCPAFDRLIKYEVATKRIFDEVVRQGT